MKTFDNGGKVAKFSLATSETYKNKAGEKVTETDWHNIVFWGPVVDVIQKHVHKGDQVAGTGKIKYRSYEKEGVTKYITEINCDSFEFCGGKPRESEPAQTPAPSNMEGQFQKGGKPITDVEEQMSDLPF